MNDKDTVVVPRDEQAQFDAEHLMDVAGTLSRCGYGEDAAEVREIAKRLAAAPSTSVREEVGDIVADLYREMAASPVDDVTVITRDQLDVLAALKPSTDKGGVEHG